MSYRWISIVCIVCSCGIGIQHGHTSLESELKQLFTNNSQHVVWSIAVEDADSNETIFALTPERQLIPASNMKLVVCAAALLQLGPDFRYSTELHITGNPAGQVLQGDVIVVGSGDPSIGGRFKNGDMIAIFKEWASVLKQNNIHTILGNIIGVDDAFDDVPHGLNWSPQDLIEWYAAEVSALSFNDACLDVSIQGGAAAGQTAQLSIKPDTQYLTIQSSVQTVAANAKNQYARITRDPKSREVKVVGKLGVKRASTHYVTVPNPTHYFVTVMKETLEREGIKVAGDAYDGDDVDLPPRKDWKLIHTYQSPPLSQLIDVCLKNSQNLYAEHFVKTLGHVGYGLGSWQNGIAAIKDILFRYGCELDDQYIADGSGLSRDNRINSKTLTSVLHLMASFEGAESFREALPIAGVDGTLRSRMRGTPAYKRVKAKTGTLNGVRSLSGYIFSKSGKVYVFSMLGNSDRQAYQMSRMMEDACAKIAEEG